MSYLKPLPDCEGPKLEPFTQDLAAHDVKFLSTVDEFTTSMCDSTVFKVRIDGRVYALKVVS
jgi:hypothetical protein